MKPSKTSWLILGIGIIIIAAASLFMLYQGQVEKRGEARASLANAEAALPKLIEAKEEVEARLSQSENEVKEWQNEISQLEARLAQAELTLNQSGARFPASVESIEYDEVLFNFAHNANLRLASLTASEPAEIAIEGITYATTSFTTEVKGEVADILSFINTIVTDKDFQTAILEPVTMNVPEPLTETEKENMTQEEIAEAEMPSATINLMVYTYQGE